MSVEVVALVGGIFFLLVAIVGGGFAIREIVMPTAPHWARAASGVFGLLLLLPFLLAILNGRMDQDATPAADTGRDQHLPRPGASGIEIDAEPATTGDQIRLTGLTAAVRNDPPRVGDTVTVKYSLTNTGSERIQLASTFVGARDPANEHADAEEENENRILGSGETIQAAAGSSSTMRERGRCGLVTYSPVISTVLTNGRHSASSSNSRSRSPT